MRRNLHENFIPLQAMPPTTIAAGNTANGVRLVRPSKLGRQLWIHTNLAANTGVTVLTIGVSYSLDGGTTWNNLLQIDGVTPLTFTAANTIAGNTQNYGTLPLDRVKGADLRVDVRTVTGASATVAITAIITDLFYVPSGTVDDLLFKVINT